MWDLDSPYETASLHAAPRRLASALISGVLFLSCSSAWPQGLQLPSFSADPIAWLGDGPPDSAQAATIAEAAAIRPGETPRASLSRLEKFVENFPQSGWTPSLREVLAEHASQHLHYERAMSHWAANLQALREERRPDRKAAADRALAFLTRHLLIAGEMEKLGPLLEEFRYRTLDEGPLSAMRTHTAQKYRQVLKYPTLSYKCGLFALDRMAMSLGWQYPRHLLRDEPSGPAGLSLLDLQKIAGQYGLAVVPVRAVEPGVLPVPSVMHTRLGHFVTLLQQRNGELFVFDPGAKRESWVPVEDVVEEATGHFLVPGPSLPRGLSALDAIEAARWRGRTTSCPPNYQEDEDCDEGDEVEWNDGAGDDSAPGAPRCDDGCEDCCGAAVASVKRHSLNMFFKDRPLIYRPSKGPLIYPKIFWKRYLEMLLGVNVLGGNWRSHFQMGLQMGDSVARVFLKNGGMRLYTFPWIEEPGFYAELSDPHPRDGSRLRKGNVWRLEYPNGRVIEFGGPHHPYWTYPSRLINRWGYQLWFNYAVFNDGSKRLVSITDADGKSTLFDYGIFFGETRLWRIRTPDNRQAIFDYLQTPAGNVLLASIADANGLVSSFTYPDASHPNFPYAEGAPHTLTTPYGTTTYDYATGQLT
jgi:hypothetical protein